MTRHIAAVLFVAVGTACGPSMIVQRRLPSPIDVGPARRIAVEVVVGKRDTSTLGLIHGLAGIVTGESADVRVPVAELQAQLVQRLNETQHFTVTPVDSSELLFQLVVTHWWTQQWDKSATASLETQLRVIRPKANGEQVAVRDYAVSSELALEPGHGLDALSSALLADAVGTTVGRVAYDFAPTNDERRVFLDDSSPEVQPAVVLMEKGVLKEARAVLEDVLRASPDSAPAHFNLGVLDENESNFPAAEEHFRRAEALHPRHLYRDALRRVKGLRRVQ